MILDLSYNFDSLPSDLFTRLVSGFELQLYSYVSVA